MNIDTRISDNILIVTVDGDLLGETSGLQMMETVDHHAPVGVPKIILNLAGVRYMNSSGIGVLITLHNNCKSKGGKLALATPGDHIKKLLTITKLNTILMSYETEEEALKDMN